MLAKTCRRPTALAGAVAVGVLLAATGVMAAGGPPQPLPKFDKVKKTVLESVGTSKDYRPGEIISRSQVEPIFRALARIGWRVAAQKAILEAVLPDNDLLVKELRAPSGRKFARQLAAVPAGYDRLDRLSRLPRGPQNVRNLIRGPDGYLMIEYMTTTPGGANLGGMLSQAPGGKDFNKTTGRIYTVDMLMDRLEQEYAKATAVAKNPPGR